MFKRVITDVWSWHTTRKHSQPKTHAPPQRFLYLRKTSWRCEEEGGEEEEEEKVSLLTYATARGVGKNMIKQEQQQE